MPMDFNVAPDPRAAQRLSVDSHWRFMFSPSQIGNWEMCQRIWGWQKIEGLRSETTPKQQFGLDVHAELEPWLKYGKAPSSQPAGKVAKQGIRLGFLPSPGPHLIVEDRFEMPAPEIADDTCFTGLADVIEPPDLTCSDPTVDDHKTTTSKRWMKDEKTLRRDPQVMIYSEYAGRKFNSRFVRCRWIYYLASNPKTGSRKPIGVHKVDFKVDRESPEFRARWAEIVEAARTLRHHKLNTKDVLTLIASPAACQAFNGCDFVDRCGLSGPEIVAGYIEQWTLEHNHLSQRDSSVTVAQPDTTETSVLFDDLDKMTTAAAAGANPLAQPDVPPATAAAPAAPPVEPPPPATGSLLDQLKALETTGAVPAAVAAPAPAATGVAGGGMFGTPPPAAAVTNPGINPPEADGPAVEAAVAAVTGAPAITAESLDEMGKVELVELAKKTGATVSSRMKVATMRAAILATVDLQTAPPATAQVASALSTVAAASPETIAAAANQTTGESPGQPSTGLVVIFDGAFLKNKTLANGVQHLIDVMRPVMDFVAKENNVEHWALAQHYVAGRAMLQEKFRRYLAAQKIEGIIIASTQTAECQAVRDVLIEYADVAIQGKG